MRWRQKGTGVLHVGPAAPFKGWELEPGQEAQAVPTAEAVDVDVLPEDSEAGAVTGTVLPGSRATVKDWVEFMAQHEIRHPEDATRPEMRALAEAHFEAGE